MTSQPSIFIGTPPPFQCPVPALLRDLDRVKEEIQMLHFDRAVRRSFDAAAAVSPAAQDSYARWWFAELYFRRAALTVRAMLDANPDSCSLANLMGAVADSAATIQCPFVPEMQVAGGARLDPQKVQDDLAALRAAAEDVRKYVNKYLAHVDRVWKGGPPDTTVTDSAVDLLGELLKKYTLILTGADLVVTPLPHFDVTAAFREAWLPAAPSAAAS